jgi:CHAD domain-containing protein
MNPAPEVGLRAAIWNLFETNRDIVFAKLKVKPGPDQEEAIHEFRVAVKKIRTVFRLIHFIAPTEFHQKKEIADLRKVFRAAGPLRELEVDEEVLWVYEKDQVKFHRRLSQLLRAERRVAQPMYEEERKAFHPRYVNDPGKKVAHILAQTPEPQLLARSLALCDIRLHHIWEVLPKNYEPEMIHKTRILVKEALYLMGILQNAGYAEHLGTGLLESAKLAAEIAGDWHDREVFYQWLQIQLRPDAPLGDSNGTYEMLLQDLHAHTRLQVSHFRKSLATLARLRLPPTGPIVTSPEV